MRSYRLAYGFVLFLLARLFSGCIPEPLDVGTMPVVKPQIVVSSQIIPDENLVILLTRTFGALEAGDDLGALLDRIAVRDAIVLISGPLGIDTLTSFDNGIYGGDSINFQPGEEYTVHVKSATLGEVSATTRVMEQITFQDIDAELYFDGYDDTLAQITHSLVDPEGVNKYMINVQRVRQQNIFENILNPRAYTKLHEDSEFTSELFTEQFKVVPGEFKAGDTILVSLSNISVDYYNFIKIRMDNRFGLVEFLSEPVNYPSNVKGGKGFFNLYTPDFRFFVLK